VDRDEHDSQIRTRRDLELFEVYVRDRDPDARARLVERFLPLARQLARRYEHTDEPLEDLVQVASIGLVKAIDRFDPERGFAFSSFAVPTILGELRRHFRDKTWSVRVPRDLQELSLTVERVATTLTHDLHRPPTIAEIAAAVGTTDEAVLEAREAAGAYRATSLQAPRGADEEAGETLGDQLGTDEDGFGLAEHRATLARLLSELTPREREILRLRFEEDMTQAEIGERVGVSQMQISRIIRRSLGSLRAAVGAQEDPV
jgi:RNA polymerase sigma-B factor